MKSKKSDLKSFYNSRVHKFNQEYELEKQKFIRVSWLRLFVFLTMVVFFILGFQTTRLVWFSLAIFSLSFLLACVRWSTLISTKRDHMFKLKQINSNELSALSGDYSMFEDGHEYVDPGHPYSIDLDLFGSRSLFQYLNRSYFPGGRFKLAEKLSKLLTTKEKIEKMQISIQDMSGRSEFRQHFQAFAMTLDQAPPNLEFLQQWLSESLFRTRFYQVVALISPLLYVCLLVLGILGKIPLELSFFYLLIPLTIVGTLLKRTNNYQSGIHKALKILSRFGKLIKHIEGESFKAQHLIETQKKLERKGLPASKVISKLSKILGAFDSRLNLFVGFLLNALMLWDIHCLVRIEKWKLNYGREVIEWFESLSEFDALNSLGTFAFNHPYFSYPEIEENNGWYFKQAGHPLIKSSNRVDNDFQVRQQGEIFIITGPNMAGKSTFLRAIGLNILLAQTGAPVCALQMKLKPVSLFTSMRTTDSLQDNESYFFSELKRLKMLFEKIKSEDPVFFLLDEVLKGTNSLDQSSGSAAIITNLIKTSSVGLIATHDLSLGELTLKYPGRVINRCFEVEIDQNELKFDYKIRDGLAQNMNANFLMKKMGII